MKLYDDDNMNDAFEELCNNFSSAAVFKFLFFILLKNRIGIIVLCIGVLFFISYKLSFIDKISHIMGLEDKVVNFSYGSFEGSLNANNEGKGSLYYNDGVIYEGHVKNGLRHGYGVLKEYKITYKGTWVNDKLSGKVEAELDGDRYIGVFDENNRLNGNGVFIGKNGSKYEGEFKNSVFEGQGIYTSNGNKYVGQFSKHRFNGKGVLYLNDGSKYVGNFVFNKIEGKGTMYYKDGTIETAYWKFNEDNKIVKVKY